MTTAITDRSHLSFPRLGFPHRRATGAGGYRVPSRLADGSRSFDFDLKGGLAVLRGSRVEAGAPERL